MTIITPFWIDVSRRREPKVQVDSLHSGIPTGYIVTLIITHASSSSSSSFFYKPSW